MGRAGGVAGARANQPPDASTANPQPLEAAGAEGTSGRVSETVNYEIGRKTRHTVEPSGQVNRLSVAVIIDDTRIPGSDGQPPTNKPRDTAEMERIKGLVAASVGLDAGRGDQLTVENIAFEALPDIPEPAGPGVSTQALDLVKEHWLSAVRLVAVLLVAAFAFFGVLRPLVSRVGGLASAPALPAAAAPGAILPTVSEMEGQIDAELDAMVSPGGRRLPVLSQRVAKLANDEPEQVARIVRGWISEDGR
jgi:flagellar M-ring protein FliF